MGRKSTGSYLRTLRENKGLSQRDIANLLAVSEKQVLRWEKGLADPAASMLISFTKLVEGDMYDIAQLLLDENDEETEGVLFAHRRITNKPLRTPETTTSQQQDYVFQILEIALRLRTDGQLLMQYAELGKKLFKAKDE